MRTYLDPATQHSYFTEVCESMDHGLLWLDHNLCIQGHNQAFLKLLAIDSGSDSCIGKPFRELLHTLQTNGEFIDEDSEQYLADHLASLDERKSIRIERVRPNGIALSVVTTPLPSGGYVYTYRDISQERQLRESLRRNTKASVIAMANLAEHRDADTGIHVLRVARLVGQTARKLMGTEEFASSIDESFVEHVSTACILHDIGKISTPDQILLKTGVLTEDERDVIKLHTTVGAQLIKQAKQAMDENPYLEMGAEIALSHHEWFDGRGYPNGLSGCSIPISGRICAVADVFDALISHRPYKRPWSTSEAIDLIKKKSGSQFDPDVVTAFLEVIKEREMVYLVRWSDALSVGNAQIDDQHRILVDTINQLASAESLNNHYAVSMIIDELLSYAAFHFYLEEKLMAESNYPYLQEHIEMHKYFVNWVQDFRDDYVTYGKRALGEPVLKFLKDWLIQHIFEEDKRYSAFLKLS